MKKLFVLFVLLLGSFSFAMSGKDYFNEGVKADKNHNYIKAAELYKKACDMGYAQGCNNLGLLYVNGQGVRQSYTKAAELYKKACDMGFTGGCKAYAILNK